MAFENRVPYKIKSRTKNAETATIRRMENNKWPEIRMLGWPLYVASFVEKDHEAHCLKSLCVSVCVGWNWCRWMVEMNFQLMLIWIKCFLYSTFFVLSFIHVLFASNFGLAIVIYISYIRIYCQFRFAVQTDCQFIAWEWIWFTISEQMELFENAKIKWIFQAVNNVTSRVVLKWLKWATPTPKHVVKTRQDSQTQP